MPRDVPNEVLSRKTVNQLVEEKISPIREKIIFLWNCFTIAVIIAGVCYLQP